MLKQNTAIPCVVDHVMSPVQKELEVSINNEMNERWWYEMDISHRMKLEGIDVLTFILPLPINLRAVYDYFSLFSSN